MTRHTQHPLPIGEIATRAVAAHRALRTVVREQRAALSQTDRDAMDAALGALAEDGLFDGDALSVAEETGARLDDAIARAGGAPEKRWTEEGHGYLVGGTEQASGSSRSSTRSACSGATPWRSPIGLRPSASWPATAIPPPAEVPQRQPLKRSGQEPRTAMAG
ncbi:MAG: hypothetical protein V2J02_22015 [Pseudomonadales bacterium]|nr:hypothetical protein [Pseudomonadales bacterium]